MVCCFSDSRLIHSEKQKYELNDKLTLRVESALAEFFTVMEFAAFNAMYAPRTPFDLLFATVSAPVSAELNVPLK